MPPNTSLTGAHHPDVGRKFGPYRVLSLLGEGGMGIVYLAEHRKLGRKVAIKRLKERYAVLPEAVERFFQEARTVNRINHPNIVDISDFVHESNLAYCVMELLEGQTVAKALKIEGVLSPRRAFHICHQVALALEAAHEAGVVHMDIKPSNIFLTEKEGQHDFVKLLDFGIARLRGAVPDDPAASFSGSSSIGTPAYMSPEQAGTLPVDHRSDLYSLGAVLYEILAGSPPFKADTTPEYVYKHINVRPITLFRVKGIPQRIPPAASRVVMRCLEKNPEARFQSAAELAEVLQRAAKSSGIILRPGSSPTIEVPTIRDRRPYLVAGGALVAIAAVATAVILGTRSGKKDQPAAKPAVKIEKKEPRPKTRTISLVIRSTPAGAEVVRIAPAKKVLGLTPLTLNVPGNSQKWSLVLKRDGYQDKKVIVILDQSQTLSLELKAKDVRPPPEEEPIDRYRRPSGRRDSSDRPRKPRRDIPGSRRLIDPFGS